MDERLIKFASRNAPRYTSYPTAPHFEPVVNAGVFESWLSELPHDASVSLYLHQPYCAKMCWYCGCHAFALRRDEPMADYVATLLQEIDRVAAAASAHRVLEIHWGGGTPNLLSVDRFSAITSKLNERFDLSHCVRHAMEMDPRLVTVEQARALAAEGVNRASLGAQDFDPEVQRLIGREQPFALVRDAVTALRHAGIEAISLDLMYGLPGQTLESVRDTARRALDLKPSRLSVFGYAHVPWFKTRQRLIDAALLPSVSERFDLAEAIRECVEAAGYVSIGYDHYARPDDPIAVAAREGGLARNFQGFVEASCDALIGLGPSSISTLPQGYAQNESNVTVWRQMIGEAGLATRRGRVLTDEDRRRREMIMRLLCTFSLDLGAYGGREAFVREVEALDELEAAGLARVLGNVVFIPEEARPFARLAAQAFDLYAGGGAKHSQAV